MTTKTTVIATAGASALLALGLAVGAQAAPSPLVSTPGPGVTATADAALTQILQFSREEERLARDLYAALAAVYDGARPMSMITTSEQKHFDAIGTLLARYGLSDPSAGKPAGTYAYPELQKLYDEWFAEGKASLTAAYQVGVELETRDIADLEKAINTVQQADVDRVLGNLLAGSRNHLSAYQSAASGTVAGPAGQGRQGAQGNQRQGNQRQGMGKGMGQGMGKGMGRGAAGRGMGTGGGQQDCPLATA